MHNIDDTYGSFHGSGYLLLDDKSSPMVGYKFVLRRDNFTGGGVILGLNDEDAVKAAELKNVRLNVGPGKFFELLVGYCDGDSLPVAVTAAHGRRIGQGRPLAAANN
jgi:hypothetical protein